MLHIVVNGEFYDFERIQRELVQQGHRLRPGPTAKSPSICTRTWAPAVCNSCVASSPWRSGTSRTRLLFAARDRFGIKPLFFAQHAGTLYLASEVKALFAAGVPARWNPQTVYATMAGGHPTETLYEGV